MSDHNACIALRCTHGLEATELCFHEKAHRVHNFHLFTVNFSILAIHAVRPICALCALCAIHAINRVPVLLLSFDDRDWLLRHCTQPEYVSELRSTIVVKIINNS
jgi:hypothetical protein